MFFSLHSSPTILLTHSFYSTSLLETMFAKIALFALMASQALAMPNPAPLTEERAISLARGPAIIGDAAPAVFERGICAATKACSTIGGSCQSHVCETVNPFFPGDSNHTIRTSSRKRPADVLVMSLSNFLNCRPIIILWLNFITNGALAQCDTTGCKEKYSCSAPDINNCVCGGY